MTNENECTVTLDTFYQSDSVVTYPNAAIKFSPHNPLIFKLIYKKYNKTLIEAKYKKSKKFLFPEDFSVTEILLLQSSTNRLQ